MLDKTTRIAKNIQFNSLNGLNLITVCFSVEGEVTLYSVECGRGFFFIFNILHFIPMFSLSCFSHCSIDNLPNVFKAVDRV